MSHKCVGTLPNLKKFGPRVRENFGHLYGDREITAVVRDLRLSLYSGFAQTLQRGSRMVKLAKGVFATNLYLSPRKLRNVRKSLRKSAPAVRQCSSYKTAVSYCWVLAFVTDLDLSSDTK